jgi:4-hydroxyacetophenone monooxygenase
MLNDCCATGGQPAVTTSSDEAEDPQFEMRLRTAISQANVPTLQMLTVQLTGEERWLTHPYTPTRSKGVDDNDSAGLSNTLQSQIREAALNAILRWRAGEPVAIPHPSPTQLIRMMSVSTGESIPEAYGPMMADRFNAFLGARPAPPARNVPAGFHVLIVGAGMSGIAAGVRLKEAGIPFTIVEKGEDVGGVWHQNSYPACGVDTPSHLYSYTFAQGDWEHWFAKKHEIVNYFRDVAKKFGVYEHVRFRTEIKAARYNEQAHQWASELLNPDGTTSNFESTILLSAVGVFGTPKWPDIPGRETFEGTLAHSAMWDEGTDLARKRVAVIGNGASAMQLVPAIVDQVEHLTVFQRSKQWAVPFPKFNKRIPNSARFLFSEVPLYEWWYRLRLAWIFDSKVYESLKIDPHWEDPEHSLNAVNAGHRGFFERYIRKELGDRQDLAPRVIPGYPPYGKRMLLDNGWFRTLTRPDVELVDDPILRIDETGIQTASKHYDFDVIVTASGFDVARFLLTLPTYGRGGMSVREAWDDDDPQAYLGTVIPGFPNMFMLYGPNTGLGHGGSFMYIVECQINYVLSVLEQMMDTGLTEVDCRREVCDEYNATMQDMHSRMVWTHPGTSTYYRNSHGRVVANSPWRTTDYWSMTRTADLSDFHTTSLKSTEGSEAQAS